MKTIQMLNLESIGRFHRSRRVFAIIIVVFSLMFLTSCTDKPYDAKMYKNMDSVLSEFQDGRENFENFSELLCDNQLFYDLFEKTSDNDIFGPYSFEWDKYFSKKQFKEIEDFFHKYQPYSVSGMNGHMKISFLTSQNIVMLLDLSHLEEMGAENELLYYQQDYDVVSLGKNWYYMTRK